MVQCFPRVPSMWAEWHKHEAVLLLLCFFHSFQQPMPCMVEREIDKVTCVDNQDVYKPSSDGECGHGSCKAQCSLSSISNNHPVV